MPGDLVLVKNLNVGGLAKPVTTLVNKVSYALGGPFVGAFRPMQIRRVAEAEADAIIIHAQADAEAAEIRQRTSNRLLAEEMRSQANIESTMAKAIPHVTDEAKPENMEDDWIVNWSEKCRTVSDEQMQEMWARILAGEANNPGTFSRKTTNILADMDKADAELFATLSCFVWTIDGDEVALIRDDRLIFPDHGMTIQSLANLESLGLVSRTSLGFRMDKMPAKFSASYFGRLVELTLSDSAGSRLRIGSVVTTAAGRQLGPLCDREPINGLFDHMCDRWRNDSTIESVELVSYEQPCTGASHRLLGPEPRHEVRESIALSIN